MRKTKEYKTNETRDKSALLQRKHKKTKIEAHQLSKHNGSICVVKSLRSGHGAKVGEGGMNKAKRLGKITSLCGGAGERRDDALGLTNARSKDQ
jgi:hypothetical protein